MFPRIPPPQKFKTLVFFAMRGNGGVIILFDRWLCQYTSMNSYHTASVWLSKLTVFTNPEWICIVLARGPTQKLKKHCFLHTHTSYLPGSDQIWLTELHYCGLFAVQGERAKGSLMGEGLWMNSSGRVWMEPREMWLTSVWLVLCWGATTTMCSREQMGPAMEGVTEGGAQKQYATAGPAVKPDPPLWSQLVVWIARVSSSLSITSTPVFARSDHRQYRTWHNPDPLHITLVFDISLSSCWCLYIQCGMLLHPILTSP